MTTEQRLRATNLNLLPALLAILRHRNLTQAARELNITQSAASNSLRRLRDHFGDDLLVKDGRTMRLTEKAKSLIGPLERSLISLEEVLADEPFAPATAERRFRIGTADYVSTVLMPKLLDILAREAPRIGVQMLTATSRTVDDLRTENIDLVIAPKQLMSGPLFGMPGIAEQLGHENLFVDRFVCVGRADDKTLKKKLSLDEYLRRPHAGFFLTLENPASLEQAHLREHGIAQFDRILTSNFNLLPMIAANSDCLALIPESLARLMAAAHKLRVMESPLPVQDLDLVMIWHGRRRNDPDLNWLKATLRRCIPDL